MSYIPMMAGHWKCMTTAQSARFRQHLGDASAMPGGPTLADTLVGPVRHLPLDCYPGWVLAEADLDAGAGATATVNLMYGPGAMWLVDGTSLKFHLLNTGQLSASPGAAPLPPALAPLGTDVTGPQYLRLFCGAVWGAEGPFTLIDDAAHPVLAGADDSDGWLEQLVPLSMRTQGDGLVADAVVVYGQDVFRARFRLADGRVTMEDDEMIARGVLQPRQHRAPLRDLRPAAES